MARDADPPDVDFVLGADDPDGEPDQPPHLPGPTGGHRRRLRLGFALVGLAVVAAVVRTVGSGPSSPGAVADPSPTPVLGNSLTQQPTSSVLLPPSAVDSGRAPRLTLPGPGAVGFCPEAGDGQSLCATSSTVPAVVLRAIRASFPGARSQLVTNEVLRDVGLGEHGLWYRVVHASAGNRLIVVQVSQHHPGERLASGSTDVGTIRIRFTSRIVAGFLVQARVSAPRQDAPDLPTVRRLAADARLCATS